MKRTVATLVMTALLAATFAGCIGEGGFGGSGAPRAFVKVEQIDDHTFIFDATDSSGRSLSFNWDLGDGTTSTDARVEHNYQYGDATYQARLVIEDENGVLDVWEDEIIAGSGVNPPPVGLFRVEKRNYEIDEPVRVDASNSFDPDGAPLRFQWDFNHLMDFDEYEAFRAAKQGASNGQGGDDDDGDFDVGGDDASGPSYSSPDLPGLAREHIPRELFGDKHPPTDDADRIQPSLFTHTVETDEPVYTLESGFPDATIFFIRLQVFDVKGGFEEIVSEEIWPVEVWNPGRIPDTLVEGSTSGTFQFGGPEEVTGLHDEFVPDLDLYAHRETVGVEVPWPVALPIQDGTNYTPGGTITLSWETFHDQAFNGDMDLVITTPNGSQPGVFSPPNRDNVLRAELDGNNDYQGDNWNNMVWDVDLYGRAGLEIDWTLTWSIRLDTNPFSPWEDPYV
jgi:hypothetical protein